MSISLMVVANRSQQLVEKLVRLSLKHAKILNPENLLIDISLQPRLKYSADVPPAAKLPRAEIHGMKHTLYYFL